jgi:uroporphyrinogen decarboxylase
MTGKERFLTSLSLAQPDTVPTYTKGIGPEATLAIARELREGVPELAIDVMSSLSEEDHVELMDLFMLVYDELEIDGYANRDLGSWYWCLGFEKVDELHIRDAWGIVYRRNSDGLPVPVGHPVTSPEGLDSLPRVIGMGALTDNMRRASARFGERKALVGDILGPYTAAWFLRGTADLLMDYVLDPDFVHAVMRFVTDAARSRIEAFAEIGTDAMILSDDVGHKDSTFMSPNHYREFVAPYHRELTELGHALGLKMILHSDGKLWSILDDVVACGFDGLNPLEPEAGMDLGSVKATYGDRICLIGNLSIVNVLRTGTAAEVEEAVIQAIEDAAGGGGYILCDSNVITSEVKVENYITMMRAAKRHGQYGSTQ